MRILYILAAVLFLGGCTQLTSNAIQDYSDLRNLARDYVAEQVRYRVLIRESCWQMVLSEARSLEAKGETVAARALLLAAYPPLMTVEAITGGSSTDALATINEARICGVAQ